MKNLSHKEISAIVVIFIILAVLGIKEGIEFLESIKPILNIGKIAFAGVLSFSITGIIMSIGKSFGIWFGKTGGSILYAIILYLVGAIMF